MSTAPSPSRLRRAWQGGVRADSAWLAGGLACLATGGALRWSRAPAAGLVEAIAGGLRRPSLDLDHTWSIVVEVADAGMAVLATVAALALAASVIAGLVLGRLGPVDPSRLRGLGVGPVRLRLRVAVGGAAAIAAFMAFDLQRRVAGASRAADASHDALQTLWFEAAITTLMTAGVAMMAAGALEAWQLRRDQLVATVPTPEQVADEARRSGSRRA